MSELFDIMAEVADLAAANPDAARAKLHERLVAAEELGDEELVEQLRAVLISLYAPRHDDDPSEAVTDQEAEDERDLRMVEALIERVESTAGGTLSAVDLLARIRDFRPSSKEDTEIVKWIADFMRRCK